MSDNMSVFDAARALLASLAGGDAFAARYQLLSALGVIVVETPDLDVDARMVDGTRVILVRQGLTDAQAEKLVCYLLAEGIDQLRESA